MRRHYAIPTSLSLCAAALPAQVTVQAKTLKTVTATAQATGASKVTKTVQANTDVTKGFDLLAWTWSRSNPCYGSGRASLRIGRLFGGLNADLSTSGGGSNGWSCAGSGGAHAPSILVTFVSPKPVAGQLIISGQLKQPIGYSYATTSVDVGNDGNVELGGPGVRKLDVVVGPKGVPVLLSSGASKANLYDTSSVAAVLFVPHSSRLGVVGTPCRGMSLEAYIASNILKLQGTGLPRAQYALLNVGVQQFSVAIPPLGCRLYTDLLASVGVPVNASGETSLRLAVPSPAPTGTFRIQVLASDGNAWHTSNGLSLRLR